MILNHSQILQLLEKNVIEGAKPTAVNSASLDIHLGPNILVERNNESGNCIAQYPADPKARTPLNMVSYDISRNGYTLRPGEFILAQSVEIFHLPSDVSCEYKLKSSMARIGLEHMNAGWCDAGWHGSVLTLELKNMTRFHDIRIEVGAAIGQMVFFPHDPVDYDNSYAVRGRYNGDKTVAGSRV